MRILAVDTCLGACSVAILDGEKLLAHRSELMERGHAEALAPMVEATIFDAGITFSSLDRLGVTTGPGTFTGQRVGLSFMRGLRLALKRPLVGVTSLSAMAHQAMAATRESCAAGIQAARSNVYFELCSQDRSASGPALLSISEAVRRIAEGGRGAPVALAGDAARRVHEASQSENVATVLTNVVASDALWVARLAAVAPEPVEIPRPLYLQAPAARIPGPIK